jgi:hypothetical protein
MLMKLTLLLAVLCTSLVYAKDRPVAQSGTLLQMDSVECGTDQKSAKTFAGEILGTDAAHQKMHTLLCPEYLLQTDRILYRIRPKDEKHPVLLPVGEKAQFRNGQRPHAAPRRGFGRQGTRLHRGVDDAEGRGGARAGEPEVDNFR